jgi:hypothetical protein
MCALHFLLSVARTKSALNQQNPILNENHENPILEFVQCSS